jgi:antitoxin (DNA-binding transcriptional repressor) of toxin-antitoxin stability system
MGVMGNDVIHVSDKEAASDFASLLARVRAGAEVIIEHRPVGNLIRADTTQPPCIRCHFHSGLQMEGRKDYGAA